MEVINKIFKQVKNIKLNGWIRDIDKIKEKFGDGVKINNMKLTLNIYWQNGSTFNSFIITTILFGLIWVIWYIDNGKVIILGVGAKIKDGPVTYIEEHWNSNVEDWKCLSHLVNRKDNSLNYYIKKGRKY